MKLLLAIALLIGEVALASGGYPYPPEDYREHKVIKRGVEYVDIRVSTVMEDDSNCSPYSIIGTIYLLTPQPDDGERPYTYVYQLSPFRYSTACEGPVEKFAREVVYAPKKQLPRIQSDCGYVSKRIWLPKNFNLEVIPGPASTCKN